MQTYYFRSQSPRAQKQYIPACKNSQKNSTKIYFSKNKIPIKNIIIAYAYVIVYNILNGIFLKIQTKGTNFFMSFLSQIISLNGFISNSLNYLKKETRLFCNRNT